MNLDLFKNLPIKDIYSDLFSPGMKKAGEALETVLNGANVILLPMKLLNEKSRVWFDNNMKNYAEKLNEVEDLTPTKVPPYVGLPIIDKLTYLEEGELSKLFINLLTKASFEETVKFVHPSYINILSNLSSDEAKILEYFYKYDVCPIIDIEVTKEARRFQSLTPKQIEIRDKLPEEVRDMRKLNTAVDYYLTDLEDYLQLTFPSNNSLYFENLHHQGILKTFKNEFQISILDRFDRIIELNKERIDNRESQLDSLTDVEDYFKYSKYYLNRKMCRFYHLIHCKSK